MRWLLAGLLLCACGGSIPTPSPEELVPQGAVDYGVFYQYGALTVCAPGQDTAVVWVRSDYAAEWMRDSTLVKHENAHKARVIKQGGCDGFLEWKRKGNNHRLAEAEAHCAEVMHRVSLGENHSMAFYDEVLTYSTRADIMVPHSLGIILMKIYCSP